MYKSFQSIKIFHTEPYSKILGYPNPTKRQLNSRLNELRKLGISKVAFKGNTRIENLNILGKGYVGIVILGKKENKSIALKIRRLDSQRDEMVKEGKLLKMANQVGVGPKLIAATKNFLVMEYLPGENIGSWFNNIATKNANSKAKKIIKKVLTDCYKLDKIGLDHGELSSISKHVIIGKKISLIDFESSSSKRRVANVTSATQGIYIGSGLSKMIKKIYKIPRKDKIIKALRTYKNNPNQKTFQELLKILKL